MGVAYSVTDEDVAINMMHPILQDLYDPQEAWDQDPIKKTQDEWGDSVEESEMLEMPPEMQQDPDDLNNDEVEENCSCPPGTLGGPG